MIQSHLVAQTGSVLRKRLLCDIGFREKLLQRKLRHIFRSDVTFDIVEVNVGLQAL